MHSVCAIEVFNHNILSLVRKFQNMALFFEGFVFWTCLLLPLPFVVLWRSEKKNRHRFNLRTPTLPLYTGVYGFTFTCLNN